MKSRLSRRLLRGTLMLTLTIVLMALCFAAQAIVQNALREDEDALGVVSSALRSASQSVAVLAALPSQGTFTVNVDALTTARTQAADAVAGLGSSTVVSMVYPQELRDELSLLQGTIGVQWIAAAERVRTASGALFSGDSGRARVMDLLPGFLSDTDRQVARLSVITAQVQSTEGAASRAFLTLFAFLASAGTALSLAYSIVTIYGLRRDLGRVSAHGRRLAQGDFTQMDQVQRPDELGDLSSQLAAMHGFQRLLLDVKAASERLAPETGRLSTGITRAGSSTRNQGKALEETIRRFTFAIQAARRVSEQVSSCGEVARTAIKTVDQSLQSIGRGIEQTRLLQERVARIEEVVSLLGDVADQTELLSLNASIEAARAGESGRGFTVVAQQVRKLADRSSGAASEIADLTGQVLDGVRRVSWEAQSSLEGIAQLQKELAGLSDSVQSVSELSGGTVGALAKADTSVGTTLGLVTEASRRIEEAAGAAGTLQEIVTQLTQSVARLRAGRTSPGEQAPAHEVDLAPSEEGRSSVASAPQAPPAQIPTAETPVAEELVDLVDLEAPKP